MPELPEVETTVRGLRREIVGLTIKNFWTDWPKYLKLPKQNPKLFQKHISNKKITAVKRHGKNILIYLNNTHLLLIHQKLSGHLMVGSWLKAETSKAKQNLQKLASCWSLQKWLPCETQGFSADPKNRFIRFIFFLSRGRMLALSDLRRFAKIMCAEKDAIEGLPDLKKLGPDPLNKKFSFNQFQKIFTQRKGVIKKLLLDQNLVSGIGNIYADEILWSAQIHPLKPVEKLSSQELKRIFVFIKKILPKAIKKGGTSMDDYRDVHGQKGNYEKYLLAYQKTNKPCQRCQTKIQRIKIGLRSSHFCPKCQKP